MIHGRQRMKSNVRNFLYDHPEHYESVYPEPNEETPQMCRRMFARFLASPPSSILDVGCGTGRDLAALSRDCPDCRGVDYLETMIRYAKSKYPALHFQVGDMRAVRLQRRFDAILCMGSAFMYALTNEEVDQVLDTFVLHARSGTLLILDLNNAAGYLGGGTFKEQTEFAVDQTAFAASSIAMHEFDRRRQLLVRRRTWSIPGSPPIEDFCEYRLFFPAELEHLLNTKGFRVLGMFDNKDLRETDLSGPRLYVAATRK